MGLKIKRILITKMQKNCLLWEDRLTNLCLLTKLKLGNPEIQKIMPLCTQVEYFMRKTDPFLVGDRVES